MSNSISMPNMTESEITPASRTPSPNMSTLSEPPQSEVSSAGFESGSDSELSQSQILPAKQQTDTPTMEQLIHQIAVLDCAHQRGENVIRFWTEQATKTVKKMDKMTVKMDMAEGMLGAYQGRLRSAMRLATEISEAFVTAKMQCATLEKEERVLQQKITDLLEEQLSLSKRHVEVQELATGYQSSIREYMKDATDAQDQTIEFGKKCVALANENVELRVSRNEFADKNDELKEKNDELETENEELKKQVQRMIAVTETTNEQYSTLEKENEELKKVLQKAIDLTETTEKQHKEVELLLQQARRLTEMSPPQ